MRVIGGYRLIRRLGRGGMAEVWVAERAGASAGKTVAVKFILDHHRGNPAFTRMFTAEAELSSRLTHSNIVQVFEAGEDDGIAYLVMEWVDGTSLNNLEPLIEHVRLQTSYDRWLALNVYIVGQLLYALSYAHRITDPEGGALGIVHRDVSPHNLLISNSGDVKLADFGVAHSVLDETTGSDIKGKLRYMPMEQVAGKSRYPNHFRAPTVDLFAAGAIFHELVDGKKFRAGIESQAEMYGAALSGTIPPLSRDLPPELEAFRVGLLEPNPEKRIQTADDALMALKRWSGYSDMRLELGQLCGGLTGIARPRAGLGSSSKNHGETPARPSSSSSPSASTSPSSRTPAPASETPTTPGMPTPADKGGTILQPFLQPQPGAPRERTAEFEFGAPHAATPLAPPRPASEVTRTAAGRGEETFFAEKGSPRTLLVILTGLTFVLAGVGAAWFFFLREDGGGQVEQVAVASSVQEEKSQASAEKEPAEAEEEFEEPRIPEPEIAAPPPTEPEPQPAEAPAPEEPTEEPPVDKKPAPSAEEDNSDAEAKPSSAKPRRSNSRSSEPDGPPTLVYFRAKGDVVGADVRLGKKTFEIRPGKNTFGKLPSGRYRVRWRLAGATDWKRSRSLTIGPDHKWIVYVSPSGPSLEKY